MELSEQVRAMLDSLLGVDAFLLLYILSVASSLNWLQEMRLLRHTRLVMELLVFVVFLPCPCLWAPGQGELGLRGGPLPFCLFVVASVFHLT